MIIIFFKLNWLYVWYPLVRITSAAHRICIQQFGYIDEEHVVDYPYDYFYFAAGFQFT